jgi:hypothetical protein
MLVAAKAMLRQDSLTHASGLDPALEEALHAAVQLPPSVAIIADLRKEACQFPMEQLSLGGGGATLASIVVDNRF